MLPRHPRRPHGDWSPATRGEVPEVTGDHRARIRLHRDFQEDRVVCVSRSAMRPGQSGDVRLELQDRQEGFSSSPRIPSLGRARTSRYSNSMRSSIANVSRRASRTSTRRPGGPEGDRRPDTRTFVSSTQTGVSSTSNSSCDDPARRLDLPLDVSPCQCVRPCVCSTSPNRSNCLPSSHEYEFLDVLEEGRITRGDHDAAGHPILGDHDGAFSLEVRPDLAWAGRQCPRGNRLHALHLYDIL